MWRLRCRISQWLSGTILIALPMVLHGQLSPALVNYAPATYQAEAQNWSVGVQNGELFAGNSSGMLHFDGETWRLYPLPGHHRVRALRCEGDTIYGGGFGEFGCWIRCNDGSFEYQSWSQNLDFPLSKEEEIWHIEKTAQGVLFQSFSTIYLFENGKPVIHQSPVSAGVMFTYACRDGLFLQALNMGLARLDPLAGVQKLPHTEDLNSTTVIGIADLPTGGLLIATDKKGLFSYQNERLQPLFPELTPLLANSQINKLIPLQEGYCIGTILNGVFIVSHQGELLEHVHRRSGLIDNTILALAEDGQGRIWVGMDQGLALVDLSAPLRRFEDPSGELGVVYCAKVFADQLFLGTNHGLFSSPWPLWQTPQFSLVEGTQGQVWTLIECENQLLCGHNDGTFVVKSGQIEWISRITGGWAWLEGETEGSLIQGTYTGLARFTCENGVWQVEKIPGLGMPIRQLARDAEGSVWGVNPYRGMIRLWPGSINGNLSVNDSRWGISDWNRLNMVQWGKEVLVRSGEKWHYLDSGKWQTAESWDGISLRPELQHLVWTTSQQLEVEAQGIYLRESGLVQFFPIPDLPKDAALVHLQDRRWLIGLSQGFLINQPSASAQVSLPALRLRQAAVDDTSSSRLLPLPSPAGALRLAAKDAGLTLEFASGYQSRELYYRYRVSGLKPGWSAWTTEASFRLPLLPPGVHQVEVERREDGALLKVRIEKDFPWYQTSWTALGVVTALFLSLWWGLARYQRWLERRWRRQQIEQERARHAREVEAKNEQLQQDLEAQNQELAGLTLNLVRKNEILLDMKQELKDLQRAKEGELQQRIRQLHLHLNSNLSSEQDWEAFEYHFSQVHRGFFQRLKADYPDMTPGDLRLAAYLRMNLSSKEIAPLLHISLRSVENKRYRLRVKLGLGPQDQLIDVLLKY